MSDNIIKIIGDRINNVIFISEFGSKLYGTNTKNSDDDFKGIFIPTYEDLILNPSLKQYNYSSGIKNEKNNENDIDIELYSLAYFCKMAAEGQTTAIDLLYSNPKNHLYINEKFNIFDELIKNRNIFISKNIIKFVQYAQHQAAKYSIKGSRLHTATIARDFIHKYLTKGSGNTLKFIDIIEDLNDFYEKNVTSENISYFHLTLIKKDENTISPHDSYINVCGKKFLLSTQLYLAYECLNTFVLKYGERAVLAKENKNIDYKAISHAFRAAYQIKHIVNDGGFTYPLPETDFIINVKTGNVDDHLDMFKQLENLIDETKIELNNSKIPDKPNMEKINNLVVKYYKMFHRNNLY